MSLLQNLVQQSHELETEDKLRSLPETRRSIDINTITLSIKRPRRYFDPLAMERLIESVKQYGVVENLIVRPLPDNPLCHELVAGERRYARALGLGCKKGCFAMSLLPGRDVTEQQ